jgi:hypothetical protein
VLKEIESSEAPSTWSHAAYGLLAITVSYFEMIGKTLNPDANPWKSSGTDFNYGFCDVYREHMPTSGICTDPHVPDLVTQFRDRLRHGLYHLAWTKKDLWIHNRPDWSQKDFDVDQREIKGHLWTRFLVNPHTMVCTIVDHFPTFIDRLNNPDPSYDGMKKRFEKFVDTFFDAQRP